MHDYSIWIALPALLLCLVVVGYGYEKFALRRDNRRCLPPGEMVELDNGRKLHLIRKGAGGPTVVIENGAGGSSFLWWWHQDKLAEFTTVCTYDRAGLGWSDPVDGPITLQERAKDLHQLLVKAAVPGPYVLVGYSYGGLLVRLFAKEHPDQVAGFVFVDAGHEAVYSQAEVWSKSVKKLRASFKVLGYAAKIGLLRCFRIRFKVPSVDMLTAAQRAVLSLRFHNPDAYFAAAKEFSSAQHTAAAMVGLNTPGLFGDIPVAVVTHGMSFPGPSKVLETHWREGQEQLAALSNNSVLIVAERSYHEIPDTEPELVINAIRQVVTAVKQGKKLAG